MKTLHIAILTACFTVATFSAIGADKIEGAFGKKLGDVFDPASATSTNRNMLTDGTPMYEFSTTNGFLSFESYYVLITPTTHKIYSIWGIGGAEKLETAETKESVIMEILKKKYGTEEKKVYEGRRIDQGNCYIIVTGIRVYNTGYGDPYYFAVNIRYYDSDLEKLAKTERVAAETKKADASGL